MIILQRKLYLSKDQEGPTSSRGVQLLPVGGGGGGGVPNA